MTEDQDDSFVILQEDEVTKLKQETLEDFRFGNDSLDKQLNRDIKFISLAVVQCGSSESDRVKADVLLKSILLLYFGNVCYRHAVDKQFYSYSTLKPYLEKNSTLDNFPIAAVLLHGSRVLLEFPSELADQLMGWLIVDKMSWRYLATHSISTLDNAEILNFIKQKIVIKPTVSFVQHPLHKCLKEEKINSAHAIIKLFSNSITHIVANTRLGFFNYTSPPWPKDTFDHAEHYGINLALGGDGNRHFSSKKIIRNNGEHGHLYINFYKGQAPFEKHSGLLLGIEQSAPGKPDQYGSTHGIPVRPKNYSASGGDFFCKKPELPKLYQEGGYRGLQTLPLADYYDSLWNFIAKDTLALVIVAFEKCKKLLNSLPIELSLNFIVEIISSPGGAHQDDFDQLFDRYTQEIPRVKVN